MLVILAIVFGLGYARPVVQVPSMGTLSGTLSQGGRVAIFRRIPYAKPPVGDLRWRPPQPYGPWDQLDSSPRESAYFGDACVPFFASPNVSVSEDCLFLNVAAPVAAVNTGAQLPVMVYLHGGTFRSGSSNHLLPEALSARSNGSTVVVTLNYRLNVFGFLGATLLKNRSTDGSTGNYGIQDQRMALQWVKEHIAAFGGSGSDVTIWGQSAGGNAVLNHLTRPASFGLYSKAIIESGGYINAAPMSTANDVFKQLLAETKCAALGCLLRLSAHELAAVLPRLSDWGPTIDGVDLTASPQQLIARGEYNSAAPILIGANRDEFAEWVQYLPHNMTEAGFDKWFSQSPFRRNVTEIKKLFDPSLYPYPSDLGNYSRWWWQAMRVATLGGVSPPQAANQPMMGVGQCSVRCLARLMVAGGTPEVFTYEFAHPTQNVINEMNVGVPLLTGPGSVLVPHASELEYVFAATDPLSDKHGEVDLAKNMSAQWLQFAQRGDPNPVGLPYWAKFAASDDITMVFDVDHRQPLLRQVRNLYDEQCDFFDKQPNSVCPPSQALSNTFYL